MDDLRSAAIQVRESVTAEQRAKWNVERDDLISDDLWYASDWLNEKLITAGCDPDLAEKIGFAAGQRAAHETTSEGIWMQSVTALRNYTEYGMWEEPGSELAEKLLFENFGNPIDKMKLLAWINSRPTGRLAIVEMLKEIQKTGKLPAKPKTPWEEEL